MGTNTKALKAQKTANQAAWDYIREQGEQARSDIFSLYPAAEYNRNLGFQGALDVYGQTIPLQFDSFQQGNVGAQNTLLAGLPQQNNAILGLPTDLSGLQAQTIPIDTSFAQQQLPDFVSMGQAFGGQAPQYGQAAPGGIGETGGLGGAVAGGSGMEPPPYGNSMPGSGPGGGFEGGYRGASDAGYAPGIPPMGPMPPGSAGGGYQANPIPQRDTGEWPGRLGLGLSLLTGVPGGMQAGNAYERYEDQNYFPTGELYPGLPYGAGMLGGEQIGAGALNPQRPWVPDYLGGTDTGYQGNFGGVGEDGIPNLLRDPNIAPAGPPVQGGIGGGGGRYGGGTSGYSGRGVSSTGGGGHRNVSIMDLAKRKYT